MKLIVVFMNNFIMSIPIEKVVLKFMVVEIPFVVLLKSIRGRYCFTVV